MDMPTDSIRPMILAPFDRPGEASLLGAAGANELYGGVQPDCWGRTHLPASQRTFDAAHFSSEDAFAAAVAEAQNAGLAVHLTLNAPLYDPASCQALVELAERAAGWGVAGVIAGDLGLLARLKTRQLPLTLTLSTLAGAWNRQAVMFFRRFGVARVVLPRHLHLEEMGAIAAAHADVEFEAFVLVGKCPNAEALCSFQHTAADRRWPCEIPYRLYTTSRVPLTEDHPVALRQRLWQGCDRRDGCGLCAIPGLVQRG
ncbi:MAG TPA: U32 family peptidase, partial [Deferrisomatales bacterium]|nr:U32 family peptidase [Deferrisomatales bacterium]